MPAHHSAARYDVLGLAATVGYYLSSTVATVATVATPSVAVDSVPASEKDGVAMGARHGCGCAAQLPTPRGGPLLNGIMFWYCLLSGPSFI